MRLFFGLNAVTALVFLFPHMLFSSEPNMEIIVDRASMIFSGISAAATRAMADANKLGNPDKWPVLKTTALPAYELPEGIKKRAKDHPEWKLNRLFEYRVAFREYSDQDGKQRVVFLYHQESKVLLVLYVDMPDKGKDPDSPF